MEDRGEEAEAEDDDDDAELRHGDLPPPCINDALADDHLLLLVLSKLPSQADKNAFGLACKRWMRLQSGERRRLCVRAGPLMLHRLALRFTGLRDLDLAQSASRSFSPGVSDLDLLTVSENFKLLERISLRECKGITDVGLKALGCGLSTLCWIDLSDCKRITDKGIESLVQGCPLLQSLDLRGCKLLTDKSLEHLGRHSKHLIELNLHGCTNVGDLGLTHLSQGCTCLQILDVSMCSKVSSGVQSLAERCMELKALNLSGCSKIKDVMIVNLAEKCMHLESLTLNGCRMLSDEGVRAVVRYRGSTLKVFGLGWLTNISDEAVKPIFTFCSAIEFLDLQSSNITDNCFMELTVLSSLKVLKLNNCNSITSLAIIKIADGCPQLEKLDLSYCDRLTVDMVRDITLPEGCMLLI